MCRTCQAEVIRERSALMLSVEGGSGVFHKLGIGAECGRTVENSG